MRTLSRDVRLVGDLLGAVLRAHGGSLLFDHEEAMRLAAKRAREEKSPADREDAREVLVAEAAALSPDTAVEVVRAFTLYFQLVNVAEDVHRVRKLRNREADGGPESVSGSIAAVVLELAERGASRRDVLAALSDLDVSLVFTSHPTEARRRTTERLLWIVRVALERLDRVDVLAREREADERHLRAAIEALWEHAPERRGRPEVLDEVQAGLFYLREVLLDVVPEVQRTLHAAIERRFGATDPLSLPVPVRFGSWMGADRDGNPFVTEGTLERTIELQRRMVLDRYMSDLRGLVDPLAAATERLAPSAPLDEALERAEAAVPEAALEAERRNADEPLRKLLTFMLHRVKRTRDLAPGGYASPWALLDDLGVLRDALLSVDAVGLANDALLDLIVRVRAFGFVLAELDVREDSRVHKRVVAELLSDPDYPERDDASRIEALSRLVLPTREVSVSADARRLLDLFGTLRRVQARFSPESVSTYVISMTESAADVIEIVTLAELFGLGSTLDVVPLFESRVALDAAAPLLTSLFDNPVYARHLARRGGRQEVLLGYSDSMKEGGIVFSRVRIRDAQRAIAAVCRERGVSLCVFHGRGGSVSRGGGPAQRAIRALPPEAFSGRMKLTEQGETRAQHFAHPELAGRYLEQTIGAALAVRYEARSAGAAGPEAEAGLFERLAETSWAAYRALVDDDGLIQYFQEATPFRSIAALQIGSRPTKRRDTVGLSDLRAIPWVFAWSQSRHILTAWYGAGSALSEVAAEPSGLARLQGLYEGDAFFRDLCDSVQMSLAKSDLPIAARYASLCTDPVVRDRIFGMIEAEYEKTVSVLLEITQKSTLLGEDSVLKRSIRLRNPYVDPLSYLQVEALRRARKLEDGDPEKDAWQRVSRVAVQGIAAGLRNTG